MRLVILSNTNLLESHLVIQGLQVQQRHPMILLTDHWSLLALIPMTLIYQLPLPSYADSLIHIQYAVQEKETAKNMLQGIKRLQLGFPSMDIDHFAL